MFRYIIRKIVYGFLVLLGVVTVIFVLFNIKPGDPSLMLGGQHSTPEIVQTIRKDLGLDLPFQKRYLFYLNDLSPISVHNVENTESIIYLDSSKYTASELFSVGDKSIVLKYPYLRKSYQNKRNVAQIINEKLPDTFILALSAILIATILGISLGIVSAVNKGRFFDNVSFIAAVAGMSAPSFFMAAILSVVGGYTWSSQMNLPVFPFLFALLAACVLLIKYITKKNHFPLSFKLFFSWSLKGFILGLGVWLVYVIFYSIFNLGDWPVISSTFGFPGTGLNPNGALVELNDYSGREEYHWENLILPAITLGIRPLAIVIQLTRSSLLDELSKDYIRTARSKGLSMYKVIVNHALINSLNPVITAISGWFASLLAGAVFVEQIFDWNGIGKELVSALKNDDFPLVIGVTIVIATFFVIINIVVDIVYGYLDPRVRLN